jgi:hypothetical protein
MNRQPGCYGRRLNRDQASKHRHQAKPEERVTAPPPWLVCARSEQEWTEKGRETITLGIELVSVRRRPNGS